LGRLKPHKPKAAVQNMGWDLPKSMIHNLFASLLKILGDGIDLDGQKTTS
jgi:hypothetical protein